MALGKRVASRRTAKSDGRAMLARSAAYGIEALEQRLVLSAVTWTGAAGDNLWTTPGNWSNSQVPGPADDVMIVMPAATITLSSGMQSIHSLTSSDPIDLTGGTLAATTTIQLSANLTLSGGTIQGGTITESGGAELVATTSGGTLDGVTLDGNLDLTLSAQEVTVTILDGLTLNGTATIGGSGGDFDFLDFSGSQTLGGTGTVSFDNAGYTGLLLTQNNTTLTLGSGITIDGGSSYGAGAQIGFNGWAGGGMDTSIINQGTIDADASGKSLSIYPGNSGGTFTNQGTIEATNGGTLNLAGMFKTATLGTLNGAGGTINLIGTLNNAESTLALTAATGSLVLSGGTIQGGTITESGGAELVATTSGGTLDGVTLDGNLDLTLSAQEVTVTILDGLTLNGTATIGGSGGDFDFLDFSGSQTLGGTGTVSFDNAGYTGLLLTQNNTTLTLGSGITIDGGSSYGAGAQIGFNGWAGGGMDTSIINQGTIDADASGKSLTLYPGNSGGTFTNQGTIEATNGGTLNLAGMFTTATLGTLNGAGGTIDLTGTLNNAGSTLALTAITGSLVLSGGTIQGGTITESGGAELVATTSGGTLDGVTLDGNLDLTLSAQEVTVTILDGLTLNGTATIGGSGGDFDFLDFSGSQTLGGTGTVSFGNAGYTGLLLTQNNTTLTLGSGITIDGGSSYGAGAQIGFNGWAGGGMDTSIINQGTIDADASGKSLTLYPGNSGGTFTNQGTIEATNGGTLNLAGMFTTATLGTLNGAGGTIDLTGTLNNAGSTLALTAITGSLVLAGGTIQGGTITESGGAELVATTSGGTLDGVTLDGNLDLTAQFASVTVVDGLTLNGTATIGDGTPNDAGLNSVNFSGSQTLGGNGMVVFGKAAYTGMIVSQSNTTLTIGPGITIRGGSATNSTYDGAVIGYSGSLGGGSNTSIINQGTIDADGGANTYLFINPNGSGTFTNTGTMEATNGGTLNLDGMLTTAGLGTFNSNGGTINLIGTLDNTGATLALTAATGSLVLSGGTIQGGTITESGGAELVATTSGGTLDGVTLDGNLDLTAQFASVTVVDGLTLNGTATIGDGTPNDAGLNSVNFSGSQTLGGNGMVVFGKAAYTGMIVSQSNTTLTIGPGITIRGGSATNSTYDGAVIGYSGSLGGGSNTSIINQGTIDADGGANTYLFINPNGSGTFTNTGTMEATNGGTLNLDGMLTTAGLGTFNSNGGTINLIGTLDNTGATLALTAATGSLVLSGGTIQGGTITESGGAELVATTSGGTLDGVTLDGNLDLTAQSASVTVLDGLTLNGTATIGDSTPGDAGVNSMNFSGSQTLGGTGTVVFGKAWYIGMIVSQSNTTLTIGPGITIRGGDTTNSTYYGAAIGYSGYLGGGSNTSIINQGTIDADGGANTYLIIYPAGGTFTNTGTIEATNGGTLNAGIVTGAGGATVVNNGTLDFGGTQAALGMLTRTGGTINITATLTGGLSLDGMTGSWSLLGGTIQGGTVSETGGAELVATTSGGTLDGVTLDGNLDLTAQSASVTVLDGLTLNGTATIGDSTPGDAGVNSMNFSGSQTLGGTGTVVFGKAWYIGMIVSQSNTTLTIGPGITIRGGDTTNSTYYGAAIGYSGYLGGGSNTSIINQGTIDADGGANTYLIIYPAGGTFTNTGTIEATNGGTLNAGIVTGAGGATVVNNGTLDFGGTQAALGMLTRTGGTINITATLTGGLSLDGMTGSWSLLGGTIQGGTVSETGGAELVATTSGGTLDGVTLDGNLDLTAQSASVTVLDGLTLNGTATIGDSTPGDYGDDSMNFSGSQTLGGTGTVVFGKAWYIGMIVSQSNTTLTIGPGITIRGGDTTNSTYYGAVIGYSGYFSGGSNTSIINQGTIDADGGANTYLIIYPAGGTFTNTGTIEATNGGTLNAGIVTGAGGATVVNNGTLDFGGTQAALGMLTRTGGTINITATLTGGLSLDGMTGSWSLLGGTIQGGTVSETGGAELVATTSGGTLDGVTLDGNLDLTAQSASVTVLDGLTLNGTATIGDSTPGDYGDDSMNFSGSQTLGGTGTVVFGKAWYIGMIVSQSNTTLTIGPGITIRGGDTTNSTYYGAAIGYSGYLGGGSNTSIINQGTIDADGGANTYLIIYPAGGTFTNTGTIEATNGGTLNLDQSTIINGQGTITSSPSGSISAGGNLLGNTINADGWNPQGLVTFDGAGTFSSPQQFEAMSQDEGATVAGFQNNFAFAQLALSNNTYVMLVDQAQNSASGANAVYAASLNVPVGATLDLNGLNFYTLAANVLGSVVNGTVTVLPGGGFPDLSPQSLVAASASTGIVTVAWNDVNGGGANVVDSFTDQVQLIDVTNGNAVLATTSAFYNESASGPLTFNGGAVAEQASFNLAAYPSFHEGDVLQAVVLVDVNGNVFETSKTNNQASVTVTQALIPDLQATGITITGDSTGTVTINWNDDDAGSGPVTQGFYDGIVVMDSVTGATLYNSTAYQNAGQFPIGGGSSAPQSASFTLPTGFDVTHDLSVTVTADVYNYIFESNETNNTASASTTAPLAQYPDLQVENLAAAQSGPANNQQLNITWNAADTGSGPAAGGWYDNIQIVNTTTGQTLLSTNQYYPSNSIAAGGTEIQAYSFAFPNNSSAVGALDVTVTVNSLNNVFEYNPSLTASSNNSASIDVAGVTFSDGVDSNIAQRSEVKQIIFTFDTPVTTFNTSALSLQFHNDDGSGTSAPAQFGGTNTIGAPVTVNLSGATLVSSNGGLTWTLTFAPNGDHVDKYGSLVDGVYTLTVADGAIITAGGNPLSGANQSATFHRLYGDINGDGAVNNADLVAFKKALTAAGGVYNAPLDYNGDDSINNTDLTQLKKRFLELFSY